MQWSNLMKNSIILDIAILTAGRVDLFEKCVDAILAEMRPNYKIHVCNNGHPSKEYEEAYKKLPQGSVIKRINVDTFHIVTGKQIGRASCRERVSSPV